MTPVYSLPQTSYSDVSSGLGDVDLNSILHDLELGQVPLEPQADCQIESSDQMPATGPTDIELHVDGNQLPITSHKGGNCKVNCFETPYKQQQDMARNQSSISHRALNSNQRYHTKAPQQQKSHSATKPMV